MSTLLNSMCRNFFGLLLFAVLACFSVATYAQAGPPPSIQYNPNNIQPGENVLYVSPLTGKNLVAVANASGKIVLFMAVNSAGVQFDLAIPTPSIPNEKKTPDVDDVPTDEEFCWEFKNSPISFCQFFLTEIVVLEEARPGALMGFLNQ